MNNEKEIDDIELSFSDEDFMGYRDKSGYPVLPEDWGDNYDYDDHSEMIGI